MINVKVQCSVENNYHQVFIRSKFATFILLLVQKHPDSKNGAYCADGWSLVCSNENDCSCFQYVDGYVRYKIAEQICNGFGGELPSIHSEDKNKFLYVFPDDLRRGAWIGLRRVNNSFIWVDESDLNYASWNDDAPTNGANSSDCVHYVGYEDEGYIVPFKWRDSPCTELRPIFCEMPLSKPTTTVPPPTTQQPDPCPNNYTERCFQNNVCYCYSVKQKMYWGDGIAACRNEGADMISIHSSEENSFIREIAGSEIVWIGCLYNSTYWVDGTNMNYENWLSSYNSHNLGYMSFEYSGYWRGSINIGEYMTVVCKKPTYRN
ncbi:macrophage mannose receptor 1-like [Artemia franciscana]|uniref:C-type lectin domain-containing protein n=1 Tax=Artemia franciscana TaxID=6661 RepID=A0AA88KT39_ARTSF|nr:hypothetical protein QYM36_019723 [Artemia franciscana]